MRANRMTTEAQLLMEFRNRMLPYENLSAKDDVQSSVFMNGKDIIEKLQKNHGHSLADSIGLLRAVLNGLNIK